MRTTDVLLLVIAALAIPIGCQSNDARLAEMAQRQADREAEHSRQMSQLEQQVAEGSRQLVESDAKARQDLVELQRDLRTDQATVGEQRDALESERRQISSERRWDSIIGPSITAAALLIACVLPLFICFAVLRGLWASSSDDENLAEILVQELVDDQPLLLPPRSARASIDNPQPIPEVDAQDIA